MSADRTVAVGEYGHSKVRCDGYSGLVCHSHGGVTHWHDNDGPAYMMEAANPYRTTPIPPGSAAP